MKSAPVMLLQQTVTELNEPFQKQLNCGQFPVVDVVVGPTWLSFTSAASQACSTSRRGGSFDVRFRR